MTTDRDVGRLLDLWLADGFDQVNDRVLDTVEARIAGERQRPEWRVSWRDARMNGSFKLATGVAAAAAVLVVAVAGYNLLPGTSGPGAPTPAPTPSAQPTAAPTAAAVVDLPDGILTDGRYRMDLSLIDPGLSAVADIPAGWIGHPEVVAVTSPEGSNDGVLLSFMEVDGLFRDPCHWDLNGTGLDQPGDVVVGPTVDDLVAALKANTSYTSSAATPVSLGRFKGQELELQLPGDDVLSKCDEHGEGSPFTGRAYYVFPGGFYAQGPNSRWHLYIVDVDGTRLITMASILEGTPQADIAAAEAIVESFEFTP